MQWSDIPFDPPRRTLRQFAGLWLVFFAGLACWEVLKRGHAGAGLVLGLLAVTVGTLGLVRPRAVRPIFVAWMVVAFPIGWTISRVLLALMYYGVFTPMALIFRLIGRDPLARRFEPETATYWTPKPAPHELRSYLRQF
jgi:hypothetical protein